MVDINFCQILLNRERDSANEIYLRQPREGQWIEYTWKEVVENARRIRSFLYECGLQKGDKVGIISKNCAEWFMVDFAIALAGMVSVPVFPNQNDEKIHYVLKHAEVKLVFLGKLDEPLRICKAVSSKIIRVNFDYHEIEAEHQWQEVLQSQASGDFELPEPEDLFTIIYTSGTTGLPKGVVYDFSALNHFLASCSIDFKENLGLQKSNLASYLPLAHVYERTQIELISVQYPSLVSFIESPELFVENLKVIRPNMFLGVPRIYGVMKEKIEERMSPLLLSILLYIPGIGAQIKKKIKQSLGLDRAVLIVSGAGHLPYSISSFFARLGIIIQEGYGQAENMAYATFNKKDEVKTGYVGTARHDVEVRIGINDEILIRSKFLMKGYFKDPEASAAAFTEDGFLKTGDFGELDRQGRLRIIGRFSEVFKNQKGEFIYPSKIEIGFNASNDVSNICLVGQELPHNVLIISLSELALEKEREQLEQSLQQSLKEMNEPLRSYEKVAHILVTEDEWTIENDMVTPTLKVKRKAVYDKYRDKFENIPKNAPKIIWI